MSNAILPGTKVCAGKGMSLLYRNPTKGVPAVGGDGTLTLTGFGELHVDEFSYTPKVGSAKYASSLTSGYMRNTSGILEADGKLTILLNSDGSLSSAAGTPDAGAPTAGIGMGPDDFVDVAFFSTLANRNASKPQVVGVIHINSVGKPFKTTDQKIGIPVDFSFEGQWLEY